MNFAQFAALITAVLQSLKNNEWINAIRLVRDAFSVPGATGISLVDAKNLVNTIRDFLPSSLPAVPAPKTVFSVPSDAMRALLDQIQDLDRGDKMVTVGDQSISFCTFRHDRNVMTTVNYKN